MRKTVVGNWKMWGSGKSAAALAQALAGVTFSGDVKVVVCPPAIYIPAVKTALAGTAISVGGQDCHGEAEGAFTGEIAATMLKDAGCEYVIVGHSERRLYHHEFSEQVAAKAHVAMNAGLIPIICVGESAEEREAGKAEEAVGQQVRESLPDEAAKGHFLLAYEPVWAIGSGKTPSPADIRKMHATITQQASSRTTLAPERISVLYGGSVKPSNAREILATEGVAGVLVGGASVKAEEFLKIIESGA